MTIFESPTSTDTHVPHGQRTETTTQMLQRAEVAVIWLWSCEPDCDERERRQLMERLSSASSAVERFAFRHEFHPDDPIDDAELRRCVAEVDELWSCWQANESNETSGDSPIDRIESDPDHAH